uniref:DNA topoisomerase VI subunit B transducer domain-containing protein n=1 Tax=Rhodosorus marinus TaxID=101924 RepID=A0A6T6KKQ5_9RHOD
MITPYAQFDFKFHSPRTEKSFEVTFSRRSDSMPPEPEEVKHHPASLNQLLLKQLISNIPGKTPLVRFLTRELSNIDRALAERLIKELGENFSPTMPISELGLNEIRILDRLLKEARFGKPKGECLSPAGEYNLRLGIMKELRPDMVATHAESADAFEGHPFIVEAGVSLGGDNVRNGLSIYRFANRIPLLFEQGNDIVTKTAQDIPWGQYKISASADRIGVFCSIVSTKIPFKGTGKEYIGDDSLTIKQSVRKAIQSCCVQLKTKLARRAELKSRQDRSRNLKRYIPDVANAIMKFFESVKTPTVSAEYVRQMQTGTLTKEVLEKKLAQHVETSDRQNVVELGSIFGYVHEQAEFVHLAPRAETDMYSKPILLQVMPAGEGATQPPQVGIQFLESLRVNREKPGIEKVATEDNQVPSK